MDATTLGEPAGHVAEDVLRRVREKIPRQFQLSGPWSRRGEIWTVNDLSWKQVAFVVNDRAINHAGQQQYISLPFEDRIRSTPLLMVGRFQLREKCDQLSNDQQVHLSTIVKRMFGLEE